MAEILDGVARAGGGSYELEYDRGAPATINDPELAAQTVPTLEGVLGAGHVHELEPIMAAEDFAYFANIVPGFYFSLGTTKPGTTSGWNHTPNFMADDGAVAVGMRAMANLVWDYLEVAAQ